MQSVTVSSEFQIVIPQAIRAQLNITAGQKFQILAFDRRIELLPVEPPQQLRGFLPGLATDVPREEDRV